MPEFEFLKKIKILYTDIEFPLLKLLDCHLDQDRNRRYKAVFQNCNYECSVASADIADDSMKENLRNLIKYAKKPTSYRKFDTVS